MAIVFLSPKKKQRLLFWSISLFVALVLAVVLFTAFSVELGDQLDVDLKDIVMPDVKINFDVLNSSKVKNLEPFRDMGQVDPAGRTEPFLPYY